MWPLVLLLTALLASAPLSAQAAEPPRLVVVAVIDQFPEEYLHRFENWFGDLGFRRLISGGARFTQAHHGHFVTATAPGHAAILSGAHPNVSGVLNNYWYSREENEIVSSVSDPRHRIVGGILEERAASPHRLEVPTVGDMLQLATAHRAHIISIALKDRAAIMLGGLRPDAAYWFDPQSCYFVTSTYYAEELPQWAADFNSSRPCEPFIGRNWERFRPDVNYDLAGASDGVAYEREVFGIGAVFPHPVREWQNPSRPGKDRFAAVAGTPFGNELLLSFVKRAIEAENLGADEVPDLLAVSFSSNDYVGHTFGPHSHEVMDTVLRTDALVGELMEFLDARVGQGRWTLVVTSDHGVAPVPEHLERHGFLPAREDHYRFDADAMRVHLEKVLARRVFREGKTPAKFAGFIEVWSAATQPFVYVRKSALSLLSSQARGGDPLSPIADEIRKLDFAAAVFTRADLSRLAVSSDPIERRAFRSWHARNGGDLLILSRPYWIGSREQLATSHGTPYSYDTHVPMILYGKGIRRGMFRRPVEIVDLGSTVSELLGTAPPPANQGSPLTEALE